MICYASIGEISERKGIVKCEIAPINPKENVDEDMIFIELNRIEKICGEVEEGDIVIVEFDFSNNITYIYGRDEAEKQRRFLELEQIMNS